MRIAVGELSHETGTFSPVTTTLDGFRSVEWLHGDELAGVHRGTGSSLGGMLAAAGEAGIDVVGTFATRAQPSGTIPREVYDTLEGELLAALEDVGPVEAVCL